MSVFDSEKFADLVLAPARAIVEARPHDEWEPVAKELRELQTDIEATLAALEVERDRRRAHVLLEDLARFLPGRSEAVIAAAGPSGDLRRALDDASFATRAVAKALAPA